MEIEKKGWYKRICLFLLCLPFFWTATGLFWVPAGVRYVPAAVILAFFSSLALFGGNIAALNLKYNRFALIILLASAYAIFSYFYHGYGSREMKALIFSFVFVISFSRSFLSKEHILWIVIIAASGVAGTAAIQSLFFSIERIHGFINPILYATFSASVSILCFCFCMEYKNPRTRTILLSLSLLTMAATLLTGSRGVWIALVAAVLVITGLTYKSTRISKKRMWITALLAITVTTGLFINFGMQRIAYMFDEIKKTQAGELENAVGIRLQYLVAGAELAKHAPLFGIGDVYRDNLQEMYDQGKVNEVVLHYSHFHNQYLDTLVRKGAVGLVLLFALMLYPIFVVFNIPGDPWRKNISVGFFVLYLVSGMTDVPMNHAHMIYVYVFFMAAICVPEAKAGIIHQGYNPSFS